MKRFSPETRQKALEIWLAGQTLARTAEILKIKAATVEKWHARGNWAVLRKELNEKKKLLFLSVWRSKQRNRQSVA